MTDEFRERLENGRKLLELGSTNPEFIRWLRTVEVDQYVYAPDDKRALFSIKDSPTVVGIPCYFKYVTNPVKDVDTETSEKISLILDNRNRELVSRGLKNQYDLRLVRGVQYLHSPEFYRGIIGLIGPLEHVEGYNLGNSDSINRNLPGLEDKMKVIQFFEQTIGRIHKNGYEYRDIKNGNLIVGFNGPCRVIDWATSCTFLEHEVDRKVEDFFASPGFYDLNSARNCERDRDYLAFGVVLYNVLTEKEKRVILTDDSSLRNGLCLSVYEQFCYSILNERFGVRVGDYFKDLMNRPWPYNPRDFERLISPNEVERRIKLKVLSRSYNSSDPGNTCWC